MVYIINNGNLWDLLKTIVTNFEYKSLDSFIKKMVHRIY